MLEEDGAGTVWIDADGDASFQNDPPLAPARSHAVYRLLCEEARGELGGPAAAAPGTLPDLGLTVAAAAPSQSSTDQAVRDLMREREREASRKERLRDGRPQKAMASDEDS